MTGRNHRWLGMAAIGVTLALGASTIPTPDAANAAETPGIPTASPCLMAVAPVPILNTKTTKKPLLGGVSVKAALPSSVPPGVEGVVLTTRTSSSGRGDIVVAPSSAPAARTFAAAASGRSWTSASVVVGSPGSEVLLTYLAAAKASADVIAHVTGYVSSSDCFDPTGMPAFDSSRSGPLAAGSHAVDLRANGGVPAEAGAVAVNARFASGDGASTVAVADEHGREILSRTLPPFTTVVATEVLPPSESDRYSLTVTGGQVDVALTTTGWFRGSNDLAQTSGVLLDTAKGVGWNGPMSAGASALLPLPADVGAAASVTLRVIAKALRDVAIDVWPVGTARPTTPTISAPRGTPAYQAVVLDPGVDLSVNVAVASGSADVVVTVDSWAPKPPGVNEPVAGVTHITSPEQVGGATLDEATGNASVVVSGMPALDAGDLVVVPPSAGMPEGYLGAVVTEDPAAHAASAPPQQTVAVKRATLEEALPNADFTSGVLEVDSGSPPALETSPLPPDDGVSGGTTADTTESTKSTEAPMAAAPTTAAATASSTLPPRASFSCSNGVRGSITSSLRLTAGVTLTGSTGLRGTQVDFGFDGGLQGSLGVAVDSGTTCAGQVPLPTVTLPTLRFTIGPVPVWVTPQLTTAARLTGSVGGAIRAQAGVSIGLKTGITYRNGTFTPYFTPYATMPVSVEARLGGTLEAEMIPRLDLKVYGVVGPYAEVGPFARLNVDVLRTPWWCAEAGVRAGVGLSLDLWVLRKSYDAGRREVMRFGAGCAAGSYPGPSIVTTSLPQGTAGSWYSTTLAATGGASPYSWTVVGGSLPPGLSLARSGAITGTPTASGSWAFNVRAVDAAGYRAANDRSLAIGIGQAPPPPPPEPPPPPPPSSSVSLTKGASAQGLSGCTSVYCRWLDVSVRGFPPNTRVTIVCRASPYDEAGWWTYTKVTDGSGNGYWPGGSATGGCYYGYPGRTVWVTVNGVESNRIVW